MGGYCCNYYGPQIVIYLSILFQLIYTYVTAMLLVTHGMSLASLKMIVIITVINCILTTITTSQSFILEIKSSNLTWNMLAVIKIIVIQVCVKYTSTTYDYVAERVVQIPQKTCPCYSHKIQLSFEPI